MTLALLIMAVGGAWADGIVCTASDLGKVLCTDGSIYENVSAATTAGKTAVAMIAYVDETNKNGLAIALEDVSNEKLTWNNSGSNNNSKTAAEWCSAWNTSKAVTGGTWRLPSISDWQYMFIGCGASESYSDNPIQMSYSGLASKLTTAQGNALPVNDDYWSSTVASTEYPWTVRFGDSYAFFYNNTWEGHAFDLVRACLAFDIAEPTEWDLTPDETGKVWTLAKMPAGNVELQVEYEPTKVTMAVNDKTMGTAEVAGESKVEWTADTWKGWTANTKVYTVDDITMTSSESAHIREYTSEDDYNNSLFFFVRSMVDDATVTFSTTGDPFSRIEFTMIGDYSERNPNIIPNDNWTFEGKSAVWEGEATKSLTLQSCSTWVSKITFFKGAIPDGVTVNGDGTFTVAKTATVTLTATPAEGYKFLYWEDDQTNTNPVREVTIESGMADMTYKAVFAEITYAVTFAEGTNPDPENPEWTATPNPAKTKQTVTVTYTGTKKVIGVKAEKKSAGPVTYTELKGGEVLHVGDKIQVPETDKYWYPGGETLDYRYTYEVVRVNISGSSYETTATESETGAYYALHKVGSNYYLFATGTIDDSSRLPATATSDGIAVADNGFTNGYHKYIFSVHEK